MISSDVITLAVLEKKEILMTAAQTQSFCIAKNVALDCILVLRLSL